MSGWSIQYRGPLSSCNYACDYCPFAKTKNTRGELAEDAAQLHRFVQWVATREERIGVLFTPWGEALIRRHYQAAMTRLSHLPNVTRVVAQTNLSFDAGWLREADLSRLALWTTWHPTQTTMEDFAGRCEGLIAMGVRFSVGVVGLKENLEASEALRARLPEAVYLWVNAYKRLEDYYGAEALRRFGAVDPLFGLNTLRHESEGQGCFAGETAFTVDGVGDLRRCHFIGEVLGNLYSEEVTRLLRPRACTQATCGCHIGYIHLKRLGLHQVFEGGLLERIPSVEVR